MCSLPTVVAQWFLFTSSPLVDGKICQYIEKLHIYSISTTNNNAERNEPTTRIMKNSTLTHTPRGRESEIGNSMSAQLMQKEHGLFIIIYLFFVLRSTTLFVHTQKREENRQRERENGNETRTSAVNRLRSQFELNIFSCEYELFGLTTILNSN